MKINGLHRFGDGSMKIKGLHANPGVIGRLAQSELTSAIHVFIYGRRSAHGLHDSPVLTTSGLIDWHKTAGLRSPCASPPPATDYERMTSKPEVGALCAALSVIGGGSGRGVEDGTVQRGRGDSKAGDYLWHSAKRVASGDSARCASRSQAQHSIACAKFPFLRRPLTPRPFGTISPRWPGLHGFQKPC